MRNKNNKNVIMAGIVLQRPDIRNQTLVRRVLFHAAEISRALHLAVHIDILD